MLREFRLPDPGEGLTEAEVLTWRVAVGQTVVVNQVLLEVETAKAAVELPSPWAGIVTELLVNPGDVVAVGTPVIRIEEGAGSGGSAVPATPAEPSEAASITSATPGPPASPGTPPAQGSRNPVLVGYGVTAGGTPRRRPRATPHGVEHVEPGPPGAAARPVRDGGLETARAVEARLGDAVGSREPAARRSSSPTPRGPDLPHGSDPSGVLAKPPVRRLARELGVDLAAAVPTGPGGTITHADVERAARLDMLDAAGEQSGATGPDGASEGLVEAGARASSGVDAFDDVVALSHVQRQMATAMTRSAFTAPHVTVWVDVDVSAMVGLMETAGRRAGSPPVTPLTIAALGLARTALRYPVINASLADDGQHLHLHRHVNLGIAVSTARGLVVPHVRDAHLLDLAGMAEALGRLVTSAREGRSRPQDLTGSTITITNIGVLGVDAGTPILNPGEMAILALGRVAPRPWVVGKKVRVRQVVTLALSFDHRVIDGATGSAALADVAAFMSDPATHLALDPTSGP